MRIPVSSKIFLQTSLCAVLLLFTAHLRSAGGVVGEAGSCMIKIGFYTAHFSIYQPDANGNDVFCEDLPNVDKTIFVLEYLHQSLEKVPVDFRIIEDTQNFGQFARWENIEAIGDLDSQTVFLLMSSIHSNKRLTAEYDFEQSGNYIGIVTAPHPTKDILYHAVFPFKVGSAGYGYWPMILLVILLLQLLNMISQGGLQKIAGKLRATMDSDRKCTVRGTK
ncbi:MAG: hypothetical protein ACJATP_002876 [Candidatus Azotimanducaceae bacterium]|jgi:hypothetical protein